ncbi:unnamed protein product, partial [Protopolystoma xenopodis]
HKYALFVLTALDPDDPEFVRQLLRPAEIKEDVNLMSHKKRVSLILKSDLFRKELEEVIQSQMKSGEFPGLSTSLLSLQHISDMFVSAPGKQPSSGGGFSKGGGVIPINDLRGGTVAAYPRNERMLRCKLASVHRLIDLFGWSTNIYTSVTVRISRNHEHFLIKPLGLLYHEVTASSLLRVDSKGEVWDGGSTILGINLSGWLLHSSVFASRPDIRCIIHLDTPATIAISCMKSGLLPICQEAMILGEVSYFADYNPISMPMSGAPAHSLSYGSSDNGDFSHFVTTALMEQRDKVHEALGPTARIFFVRGRGLFALGESVEETWHYATNAVVACETQLLLASL